jgi:hypothetical protein
MRRSTGDSLSPRPGRRSRLVRDWHRLKYGLVSRIRPYPALFLPYASVAGGKNQARVGRGTEIVIEGFERSGNTFAVIALSNAQSRRVIIAHHLHAAAQIIYAVRQGIPAIVLLRAPEEAIVSFLLFHPAISASQAMNTWLRFYTPLLPFKKGFVLARFETVVSDFGRVIRSVNSRFATEFLEFEHTEENVNACFEVMDQGERAKLGKSWVEETVARPSAWRDERKDAIRSMFHDPSVASLRSRIQDVYATFESLADV